MIEFRFRCNAHRLVPVFANADGEDGIARRRLPELDEAGPWHHNNRHRLLRPLLPPSFPRCASGHEEVQKSEASGENFPCVSGRSSPTLSDPNKSRTEWACRIEQKEAE